MHYRAARSFLSMFLAALFSLLSLLAPARALAMDFRDIPKDVKSFVNNQTCANFSVNVDSNSFYHNSDSFSVKYYLDKASFQNLYQLATPKEKKALSRRSKMEWQGSCYGISTTMVLARITKDGRLHAGQGLRVGELQKGAKAYFDLPLPIKNRAMLYRINYHQYSYQVASRLSDNKNRFYAHIKPDARKKMRYDGLNDVMNLINRNLQSKRPVQFDFGYYNRKGKEIAHGIVACDIKFTWMQARNCHLCCLKLYDENDRNAQGDNNRAPRFKFILLEAKQQNNGAWRFSPLRENIRNGDERIYMWEYSDAKKYYLPRYLLSLEAQESDAVYANLQNAVARNNRLNATARYAANNAGPQLVFEDMGDYAAHDYEAYQILPYVYAPDANHIAYADSCGRIHEHTFDVPSPAPDDFSTTSTVTETILMPVDADDENAPFAHMSDYNYENHLEDEGRDLQIDLNPAGAVNGATRDFDGFDVVVSDAYLPGLSMRNGDTFAWVRGENIDAVRFSSDGRLRDVISLDERGKNLELNFGTEGELSDLDMFRFSM